MANHDDDTVSVLDSHTGRVLRTVRVGDAPVALAVDTRRRQVFVVSAGDGTLSVLEARTGRVLQTLRLDRGADALVADPYALAVDAARDRVYVTARGWLAPSGVYEGCGTLYVLEARSGAELQTISVGVAPLAVAVAERARRRAQWGRPGPCHQQRGAGPGPAAGRVVAGAAAPPPANANVIVDAEHCESDHPPRGSRSRAGRSRRGGRPPVVAANDIRARLTLADGFVRQLQETYATTLY